LTPTEAEEAVHAPHPVGVAAGEVIIDRDDMHPLAGDRVQIHGQRRGQGLALAGAHFGDLAMVQHHAADHLGVEVAHAEHALRRFADDGEGFGQHIVEGLALGVTGAKLLGLGLQRLVGERRYGRLEGIDAGDSLGILLDQPVIAAAENLFE
jgi:hypothetical protein